MKMSKAQLEKWAKLAESSIKNDEDHERALVAIRKLYGAAEGSEADQLRDRLFTRVSAYEKEELLKITPKPLNFTGKGLSLIEKARF